MERSFLATKGIKYWLTDFESKTYIKIVNLKNAKISQTKLRHEFIFSGRSSYY